ncbi:MAG TPA: ABC transporter substrate-binding protein [Nevskiaceae bacterium]
MKHVKPVATVMAVVAAVFFGTTSMAATAAEAPTAITIGTLYASTGVFATSSQPEFDGLKFWIKQMNDQGGAFVKAYNKKIPLKLIAYDDQSSTTTATTLYNQLITQNKVNILVSDFGSVLTSVAVPLAQEHKQLLFDPTGTGAKFFSKDNPYNVLLSLPTSGVWPKSLGAFLNESKNIKRVAILYDSNDFDQSQATTLNELLTKAGKKPVYYRAVPTSTSNYTVLLHTVAASSPDAVIEFGYPDNDIAFLQAASSSGLNFPMVFTVFPGQLLELMAHNVGADALAYTYTYPTAPLLRYNDVNYGPGIDAFESAYTKATDKPVNFLTVAGYNAGLVIQKTLATAPELTQLAMRHAVASFSGKLFTLNGHFRIAEDGAQIGEDLPVGQLQPVKGKKVNHMVVVYPHDIATGKAIYPAPAS